MDHFKWSQFLFVMIFLVGVVGCGGSGDQSSETVSMSESNRTTQQTDNNQNTETRDRTSGSESSGDRFENRQSSRRSGSDQSVSFEETLEQTGVYPTKVKTFESGYAQLTLNDQLTIYSIELPSGGSGYPNWPLEPGDDRERSDLVYFDNFDLKKALNKAITEERTLNQSPPLEITDMRANAYESGSLRGFMDVTINDAFTVNGVKLMKSGGDFWVAWPQEEGKDGEYYDLVSGGDDLNKQVIKQARKAMDL